MREYKIMGKIQSKQIGLYRKRDGPEGECFMVNAHFNPIALSEYEESVPATKPTSELSFRISGTKDALRAGFAEDKYPLQVVLPPEGSEERASSSEEITKEELAPTTVEGSDVTEEKTTLSLEEFECDVSVKAEATMEKQEFLFTLYDFEGHGKITKDDIAGLVRSIYDAVGSSIKLPSSGSKKIKVRLTVSPDKKDQGSSSRCSTPTPSRAADSSPSPDGKSPVLSPAAVEVTSSPCRISRKNRPATMYRQNLIDMIQASVLEKSHTRIQGCCEHGHLCEELLTKHRHRHRHANNRDNVVECRDRRNHYLDLAGVENYTSKFNDGLVNLAQNLSLGCPYQLDGTHVCSKAAKSHINMRTRKAGHHRSRSHDLTTESLLFRYQLLEKEPTHKQLAFVDLIPSDKYRWNNHVRSKSYDAYDNMCSPKLKPHLRKPLANGHSSSPHHHKHRHRERDHQRAMQQVASWIEREHLGVTTSGNGGNGGATGDDKPKVPKASPLVVERHEHHHVHEHVHHHYHHYNEV